MKRCIPYPQECSRAYSIIEIIDRRQRQNGAFTFEIDLDLICTRSTSNPCVYGAKDNVIDESSKQLFFFFMLQRCFSGFIKTPLLKAVKDSSYTCITCKRIAPRYDNTPGVLLLGDALSTRDPIVASGISVAFKDVNFWQRALREIEDLGKHGSFF